MDVLRGNNCWGDDMQDDLISRQLALDTVEESRKYNPHNDSKAASMHEYEHRHFLKILMDLPSAQPEWNNHTVACLLAELFDDTCACNYNGIDEWLPEKCEVIDACPHPVGVACWEQYLEHRAGRKWRGEQDE